jgi:prepilin-type processing-associated H-X9-DG protein
VIAIIALLIAFLLPAIARAKEQGRQVKCLANLKQVGTAMRFYFTEENEWFPFSKRNIVSTGSSFQLHGFYYGGHPGRHIPIAGDPNNWWGFTDAAFRDTPRGRPFNKYIYADLPDFDYAEKDPRFDGVRQMDVFRCTNDTGPFWMYSNRDDDSPTGTRSLYRESGASWDLNYHFAHNWAMGVRDNDYSGQSRWQQTANAYLRMQEMYWASRFIMLYEDPFDSSMWNQINRRGWHRQMNRHNFLFLDGHSANTLTLPSQMINRSGPNWKMGGGSSPSDPKAWWNNKEDPDYQFRKIDPLPGSQKK